MGEPVRVVDYLSGFEELRRRELVWGSVREPPAPAWGHQEIVARVLVLLYTHVHQNRLGWVCGAPIDVVLDERKALVVQPDVLFVSHERAGLLDCQVWGAPDLVVEVESAGTRQRDRMEKRRWYRQYGVREYWLIDPVAREVSLFQFEGRVRRRRFRGPMLVVSAVLPELTVIAEAIFDPR